MIYFAAELMIMAAAVAGVGVFLKKQKHTHMALLSQSYFIWAAFGIYVIAHVMADTHLAHVNAIGAGRISTFYRLSSIWSDHDGSWFLWVAIVGFLAPLIALHRTDEATLAQKLMGIQSVNLVYLLTMVNPFTRTLDPHVQGILNPLLHDISLGIHPPILYTGTLLLLVSCMGLMRYPTDKTLMFWVKLGWSLNTLGITLGSIWAYYELGWGGWWFWDPVENISLIPWLLGIILIHPSRTMHARVQITSLVIVCVILSGGWLVRSGLVQSVHSFAYDSRQSLALGVTFTLQIIVSVWGLTLYDDHARLRAWQRWHSWSLGAVVSIVLATIYIPVVIRLLFGEMLGFSPGFFVWVIGSMVLIGCAGSIYFVTRTHHARVQAFLVAALISVVGFAYAPHQSIAFVSIGVGVAIGLQTFRGGRGLARGAPLRTNQDDITVFSPALCVAHGGLALMLIGIGMNAVTGFEVSQEITQAPVSVHRARVQLIKIEEHHTHEYTEKHARIRVEKNGLIRELTPFLRVYKPSYRVISKTALHPYDFGIMMINFGSGDYDARVKSPHALHVSIRVDPFVCVIWFGALLMGLGVLMHIFRQQIIRSGKPALR